ncbi:uncharacterized protein LOC141652700 [Silene latifolia]|uniref:uncharacterized protein LOC141652700 n=1 Tax=Silene latifolia TaxID=37657 RepID=UPI003D777885
MMARARNYCVHPKRALLFWVLSLFLFFFAFRLLHINSSRGKYTSTLGAPISNMEQRTRMYDKMARDLNENGAAFLKHGKTSQSLSLNDLFIVKDGIVTPNPKPANPPVRANVLYLKPEYSAPISNAVRNVFSPYFDSAIWFQNSSLYHFSMFHASHHISPVPATPEEIEAEAGAVKSIVQSLCPLKIVLERVILTSTGVLLGCWQVNSGTDPTTIRAKLRSALPHAPEKQLYDAAILHTSFARLLGPPRVQERELHRRSDDIQLFHKLVAVLNDKIRGFQAVVSELWYVEELDVLALALDGRMKIRRFQLGCSQA